MTNTNNGKTIALVIIVVILALFAFRSVFFLLPFGVLPGISRSVGHLGPSVSSWLHGFGATGRLAFFLLPAALIVLWGAVLFWVYRDAEKRGMSGILWLLLVLIGNAIGLLIYAIVRSETPVREQAKAGAAEAACCPPETCAGCGKPLASGHIFCPYCGRSLKAACPACGKPVEPGWKVCPVCGANLDPGAARQV
ncbi:MAG: zinc ribbon domain-containing protein [Candidatus Aminicenantales bacterium]